MYLPEVVGIDNGSITNSGSLKDQLTTNCFHRYGGIGQCGIPDIHTSVSVAHNCDARIYGGAFDELYELKSDLVIDSTILNMTTEKDSRLIGCGDYICQSTDERILTDS